MLTGVNNCTIPGLATGSAVAYYVTAADAAGNTANSPSSSAPNLYMVGAGTVPAGTYSSIAVTGGSTLGGNVSVTGNVQLDGIVTTGVNTLTLGCDGTVTGASGTNYLDGSLAKQFCPATTSFSFPVGQNGYAPVSMTVDLLTDNPSTLTVSAIDGNMAGLDPTRAVSRYWSVTETGDIQVDMTFSYLDGDINGTEADYKVFRKVGTGFPAEHASWTIDNGANTATANNVSDFSFWGIGAFAPSASSAEISGRVLTANGQGIRNAAIIITGGNLTTPRIAKTGSFGYYTVEGLETGETYVVQIASKRFTFAQPTRLITLNDSITDADFIANPQE